VRAWWHTGEHGDLLAWTDDPHWHAMVVDWFDHFLRDADNGVLDTPASTLVTAGGRLRTSAWPGGDPTTLYAGAVAEHRGKLLLGATPDDVGRIVDDARWGTDQLPERAPDKVRLLWSTRPLAGAVDLSGLGSVDVRVSVQARAANLTVGVVVLGGRRGPDVISAGWADPQNHASLAQGEALVPGKRYDLTVELDQVLVTRIPAGRRIGLVVASSDHEHTLRPPAGTTLRVHTAGTRLVLPVVGGVDALTAALARR
jgi:X-Pro dipeptidyl-peptidase